MRGDASVMQAHYVKIAAALALCVFFVHNVAATCARPGPRRLLQFRRLFLDPLKSSCFVHCRVASRRAPLRQHVSPTRMGAQMLEWLQVDQGEEEQPKDDAMTMPVFPLNNVKWPQSEVVLNVMDPGYRKMYDDIILSGARRFLVPFSPCVQGKPGFVCYSEMPPEDRRLHAVGVVLFLEEIRELSGKTNNRVKYQAKHKVLGRARVRRLLNPSALYDTDDAGWKVDYLRAEVDLFEDEANWTFRGADMMGLEKAWQDLRQLSLGAHEPSLPEQGVGSYTPWQLADLWQSHVVNVRVFRERRRVQQEVQAWIRSQKEEGGNLHSVFASSDFPALPTYMLPPELRKAMLRSENPQRFVFNDDFWEPFLRIQGARDVSEFISLMSATMSEEARLTRTRTSLRDALSAGGASRTA